MNCTMCRGTGAVGGLHDGDEWIPVEDCFYCKGTGEVEDTTE